MKQIILPNRHCFHRRYRHQGCHRRQRSIDLGHFSDSPWSVIKCSFIASISA